MELMGLTTGILVVVVAMMAWSKLRASEATGEIGGYIKQSVLSAKADQLASMHEYDFEELAKARDGLESLSVSYVAPKETK